MGTQITHPFLRHLPDVPGRARAYLPTLAFLGIDPAGSMQQRWNVPANLLVALPADLDQALDRCLGVPPVNLVQVDVVDAQPPQ